jgi:hypothetical protein
MTVSSPSHIPSNHHPKSAPDVRGGKKQFRFATHAHRDRALIQHALIDRIYDIEYGTTDTRFMELTDNVWKDLTMDHGIYEKPSPATVRGRYNDLTKGTKTMNPPRPGEEEDHKHALEALDMLKQEISNMQIQRNEVRSKQDSTA